MTRSYLYAGGSTGFDAHGADTLVVDLEAEPSSVDDVRSLPTGADIWVRIHPGRAGHDDARGVVGPGLGGLVVARTESVVQLDALDAVLATVEADAGVNPRSIPVIAVLESAASVMAAAAIARAPRVIRLQVAEAVLAAELGLEPSEDERELLAVRSQLVLASAAAGLDAPVGSAFSSPADQSALAASTLGLRRMGFGARVCTDPAQVAVVNEVFGRSVSRGAVWR